jgi:hypothetical protein
MASKFLGYIAIKVGTYESQGKEKGEYRRIGRLMQSDDGGHFLLLNADVLPMQFNYLANKERKSSVLCSVFPPRDEQGGGAKPAAGAAPGSDDEIPF